MAAKSSSSQNHIVNMTLQATDIAKRGSAVEFEIKNKDGKLGSIQIGQGTFGWKAAGKQSFKKISWTALAEKIGAIL